LGSYCKITFNTGADERLFERREDRGEYDWVKSEKFQIAFSSYKRGKLTFRVDPNRDTKAPTEEAILFHLYVPSKNIEFSKPITVIVKEKVQYVGTRFPSFFKKTKDLLHIPLGSTRKMTFTTDVQNDYFERKTNPGKLTIEHQDFLKFGNPKLKDGILEIKVGYTENKIQKIDDIKIVISDDAGNHFELITPVEITPPESEPQLNLPELIAIEKKNWSNDTPQWDENCVARIPSWKELKTIKINMDAKPFDELKKMVIADRDSARDLLIRQIYINSVWMFLEFKDLQVASTANNGQIKDLDPREEIFEMGIRAVTKNSLQNIKKLLR